MVIKYGWHFSEDILGQQKPCGIVYQSNGEGSEPETSVESLKFAAHFVPFFWGRKSTN